MLIPRFVVWVVWMFSLAMMVLGAGMAYAQDYPNKPIRIITTLPGGGSDFLARLIAQGLTGLLGQPVIVENRDGLTAAITVAKASPDGYTLLAYGPAMWLMPFMRRNVPYDPMKDFSPISLTDKSPNVLVVNPTFAAKSVAELIALAKAKPGELNYSMGSAGSPTHLSSELFNAMAGVKIAAITYKGGNPALIGLLGGEVQLMFSTAPTAAPYIKSGKLRALAVTSDGPSLLFPGMPTVAATLPGFSGELIDGMFAPAKTPEAIIKRLNQEVVRVLNRPDVKEKFFNIGVEVVGSSPEQFRATLKSEMTKWGKIIKDVGIRDE